MKKIANTPIKRNLVANFFGIGVNLFNQILLIPLYLSFWNTELYGDWIVITMASSFFRMSDVGLNSVTSNQFSISYSKDKSQCDTLLVNNYLIVFIVAFISILGSLLYVSLFDITTSLGLNELTQREASYIFVVLICNIFIVMGGNIPNSIYRANSETEKTVYISNLALLFEGLIILVSLLINLPMYIMVTIYSLPQVVSSVYKLIDTRRLYTYNFSLKRVDLQLLKKMFLPSLTFMSFPVGHAIVLQGFTLVVNKYIGSHAVVSFNTTRTMCNFMRQLLTTMQQAVWPEYSIAYGKGDMARMRNLHRRAFKIATLGAVVLSLGLLLTGSFVYEIWTQGKIAFNYPLVISFLVVLITENLWNTSSICLIATNNHSRIGISYVILASISISVAMLIASHTESLPLIEYSLMITHLPLSIYALSEGLKMTQDNLYDFLRQA